MVTTHTQKRHTPMSVLQTAGGDDPPKARLGYKAVGYVISSLLFYVMVSSVGKDLQKIVLI